MKDMPEKKWKIKEHDLQKILGEIDMDKAFSMMDLYDDEKELLLMKLQEGLTFSQIGKKYDLTPQAISLQYEKLLLKIKMRLIYAIHKYKEVNNLLDVNRRLKEENNRLRNGLKIENVLQEDEPVNQSALDIKVADIEDLSVRWKHIFEQINVITLGDLIKYSLHDLSRLRQVGNKSLVEIREVLRKYDLKLSEKSYDDHSFQKHFSNKNDNSFFENAIETEADDDFYNEPVDDASDDDSENEPGDETDYESGNK